MYRLIRTTIVPLTRNLVQQISDLPTYKGDRRRDSARGVQRQAWHKNKLDQGMYHTPKYATAVVKGVKYRVNGGHSSQMLCSLEDKEFPGHPESKYPDGLEVVIDEYECDSTDDLPYVHDQYDCSESLRTRNDRVVAHKAIHKDLDDVPSTNTVIALSGMNYAFKTIYGIRIRNQDESVKMVHENTEFIKWASKFLGMAKMRKQEIAAAMFATFENNPEAAEKFWTLVKEDLHPDRDNAARTLSSYLTNIYKSKDYVPKDILYSKCITAANAWAGDRRTALRVLKDTPIPTLKWPKTILNDLTKCLGLEKIESKALEENATA